MRFSSTLLRRGAAALVGAGLLAWACGAEQAEAPAPLAPAQPQACESFSKLMPRFVDAVNTGRTEGLRVVVAEHLLVPERPGELPPANDLLRTVLTGLSSFARLPPEPGAPSGQACATPPPAIARSNPLCEMRRAMDTLVHEGKGLEAVRLIDPVFSSLARYIVGQGSTSTRAHFEVATVIHDACVQTVVCQMNDTLDLVLAVLAFYATDEGSAAVDRLEALIQNPAVGPFLEGDGGQLGGEEGVVSLAGRGSALITGMADPAELEGLPFDQLPPDLQEPARAGLKDLKLLLDPNRTPNVLRPLKRVLNCVTQKDAHSDLVRMFYRLSVSGQPEFRPSELVKTVRGLRDVDTRGSLLHVMRVVAQSIRDDPTAADSMARVCQTLFDNSTRSTQRQSNAELALPVVADLFGRGIASEAICAADSLIYGCAGGKRPACLPSP